MLKISMNSLAQLIAFLSEVNNRYTLAGYGLQAFFVYLFIEIFDIIKWGKMMGKVKYEQLLEGR